MARPRKLPASIPPVRDGSALWRHVFKPDDLEELAAKAGLKLQPDLDRDEHARLLDSSFQAAAMYSKFDKTTASPSSMREFYGAVEQKARALLMAMGLSSEADGPGAHPAFWRFTDMGWRGPDELDQLRFPPSLEHLLAAYLDQEPTTAQKVAQKAISDNWLGPMLPLRGGKFGDVEVPDETPEECATRRERERVEFLLRLAPSAVAILQFLAQVGGERKAYEVGKPGREKVFAATLFECLARQHQQMFGTWPETGAAYRNWDAATGVIWSRAVIKLAWSRVLGGRRWADLPVGGQEGVIKQDPWIQDIKSVAEFSNAQIGGWLVNAVRDLRKKAARPTTRSSPEFPADSL